MFNPPSPTPGDGSVGHAGLSERECRELAAVAATLPGKWLAQEDRDDLGHRTMALIDPSHGENAPVILAWREHGCLQLGIGVAETYLPLGSDADIPGMTSRIRSTLTRLDAVERWIKVDLCQGSAFRPR